MSLGNDLASIRKKNGLTLEEIQSSIKIPLYTLKSIENDSIFDSTEHNATYIRSFIRSYARALKINDVDIVNALDEVEGGIYNGSLIPSTEERAANEVELAKKASEEEATPFSLADVAPPDIEVAPVQAKPSIESVNWADVGKKFANQESGSKVWILFVVILFIAGLVVTGFIFRESIMGLFGSSTNDAVENVTENSQNDALAFIDSTSTSEVNTPPDIVSQTDDDDDENSSADPAQNFSPNSDTLTVGVYAAFNILDPVRVTSDLNWRTNPFWMEQGQAFNFDFNDSLLVRGQYSRMLLLFNGHVIENAAQQYFNSDFNSILITRSALTDPKYFNAPPSQFPYQVGAPDSLIYWTGSN